MDNRREFLKSKLNNTDNNFNLYIPIRENHLSIFNNLASYFKPALPKIPEDIKNLVIDKNLNLCRDKTILIFYQGDSLKLNTLKFYLFMNFISNWKSYDEYISNLVDIDNSNRLTFDSVSVAEISELRFREDEDNKKRLSYLYNVDILYLTMSYGTRLFDSDFFKELYRTIVGIRANQGLITVIIYPGSERQYKEIGYDNYFLDLYIKRFSLINEINVVKSTSNKKTNKVSVSKNKFNDEEVF